MHVDHSQAYLHTYLYLFYAMLLWTRTIVTKHVIYPKLSIGYKQNWPVYMFIAGTILASLTENLLE
jgi:hypothetical protein